MKASSEPAVTVTVMDEKEFGPCPLCHGLKARILFSTKTPLSDFHLVQCKVCELTRTFPSPTDIHLNFNDSSKYYGKGASKFVPVIQEIRNRIMGLRARSFLSFIPDNVKTPRILDVGCAEGRLLKSFLEYGCQCWGVEHPAYPSQRFLYPGRIIYFQGDLKTIDLPERSFDLILLWHALEHMDNPRLIMKRLNGLLAPHGVIVLAVPNFSSMEARSFKQFWFHLDVPWHKYHFNESSIGCLATKNNLNIIKSSTLCIEQGPFGLLQSILNAMGWPRNEFYEALKGHLSYKRSLYLVIQCFIGIFFLIPVFFVNLLTSKKGKGPVIKLILKKGRR